MKAESNKSNSSSRSPSRTSSSEKVLITREDGTQVYKVKKHKRSKKQDLKEKMPRQNPAVKWTVITLLAMMIIIPLVGVLFVVAKYNGKPFKEFTEGNAQTITNAQNVTLSTLKVTPVAIQAKSAKFSWADESYIKRITLNKIEARLHPRTFISNNWIGDDISAATGNIQLQIPTGALEATEDALQESVYEFGALRCLDLSIHFGNSDKAPVITNTLTTVRRTDEGARNYIFQGGLLVAPNWPNLQFTSTLITDQNNQLKIKALIESKISEGEIRLNGSIPKFSKNEVNVSATVTDFPIEEFINEGLSKLLTGSISSTTGKVTYDFNKDSQEALKMEIPFQSDSLEMTGLPMFSFLSKLTHIHKYNKPTFNHCTGIITITSKSIHISNLNLVSNQFMTIQGELSSDIKGEVTGNLNVAIPRGIIKNRTNSLFRNPSNGFYSTNVTISGNIHNMSDNLKENFESLQIKAPVKFQAPPVIQQLTPEEEFEALTR